MKKIFAFIFIISGFTSVFARGIKIEIVPGENWKSKMEAQTAVWLEDLDGNYLETLYVTNKAGKKSWIFGPKEGRPEALPVWYHASKYSPKKDQNNSSSELKLDAVTSATNKSTLIFTREIGDGPYIIKAEFNTSFDYNDSYNKNNSGVNGQPSVIYEAKIDKNSGELVLNFSGTGSLDGTDGNIHKDTKGLTTAKSIVKEVKVK